MAVFPQSSEHRIEAIKRLRRLNTEAYYQLVTEDVKEGREFFTVFPTPASYLTHVEKHSKEHPIIRDRLAQEFYSDRHKRLIEQEEYVTKYRRGIRWMIREGRIREVNTHQPALGGAG